jgi:4-hydroxybenzoate polyprenyltransferase
MTLGLAPALMELGLAASILVYDAAHKSVAPAPLLMALARFLVYLIGACVSAEGITGIAIWSGMALGAYVAGLSYLAQKEGRRQSFPRWPLAFLAAPLVLAMLINARFWGQTPCALALLLAGWIVWALRPALWQREKHIGVAVSELLAGIVLVDWLAVAEAANPGAWWFPFWFVSALFLQQRIPAT